MVRGPVFGKHWSIFYLEFGFIIFSSLGHLLIEGTNLVKIRSGIVVYNPGSMP